MFSYQNTVGARDLSVQARKAEDERLSLPAGLSGAVLTDMEPFTCLPERYIVDMQESSQLQPGSTCCMLCCPLRWR